MCPKNADVRKVMIDNVRKMYMWYNIKGVKTNDSNKHPIIPFIEDAHNPMYAKQFIFPSLNINMEITIAILNEIIGFIDRSERFNF